MRRLAAVTVALALAAHACGTLVGASDEDNGATDASAADSGDETALESGPIDEGDPPPPEGGVDAGPFVDGGRLMFVSSQSYAAPDINGFDHADVLCDNLAAAAGMPGNYSAFLAGNPSLPTDDAGAGWFLRSGVLAFDQTPDMSGKIRPNVQPFENERGITPSESLVWTGWAGHDCAAGLGHAYPWTNALGAGGDIGNAKAVDAQWVRYQTLALSCGQKHRLYCFQK